MTDDQRDDRIAGSSRARLEEVPEEHLDFLEAMRGEALEEIARLRLSSEAALSQLHRDQMSALALIRLPTQEDAPVGVAGSELESYFRVRSSVLMDANWYLLKYPDVAAARIDPVLHYLRHGWREDRSPGPVFDGPAYLQANPDVRAADLNPLVHYLAAGAAEGRNLSPSQFIGRVEAGRNLEPSKNRPARAWFFLGDTLDWLNEHAHLTGVGKVTSELFFALVHISEEVRPCVIGDGPAGLLRVDEPQILLEFAERSGHVCEEVPTPADVDDRHPCAGDHVFLTGVIWTDVYVDVMRRLKAAGLTFSVLVHDIIPLLESDTERPGRGAEFSRWLAYILAEAEVVYVSNTIVAKDLSRWAVAASFVPGARVRVINFGRQPPPGVRTASSEDAPLNRDFVVSVGTIDARKNQRSLVKLWSELAERRGAGRTPTLVLAGRDDIGLSTDEHFKDLAANGLATIFERLSDRAIAGLFRSCLFSIFPSKHEGFGLPVSESLAHGAPCLTADLPAIREHAGDFAWYFNPDDEVESLAVIEQLLDTPDTRDKAAERLKSEYVHSNWSSAAASMLEVAQECFAKSRSVRKAHPELSFASLAPINPSTTLSNAGLWCVEDDPEVSIIILNWNAARLTMECVRQIWSVTENIRYEIVIVDNGSDPDEKAFLDTLGTGTKFIDVGCNRFFGEANNIGVEAAKAPFVLFLNNDAFVSRGWLTALVEPLRMQSDLGATGPLFLFPDGRVQEAGGSVDARGYPVRGARDLATLPAALMSPRRVDYVSGAALLVRKHLFERVGGFDLTYEPVYYEDTDLCFKLRALGGSVQFCPEAVVTHVEGASSNGDEAAELRRRHLGDLHRGKFVARWEPYLQRRDEASLVEVRRSLTLPPSGARRSPRKRRALVYTSEALTPGGGERYLLTLVESLLSDHEVELATSHPYSRMRVLTLGAEFGLDLRGLDLTTDPKLSKTYDDVDLQLVMGNHILPPAAPRARRNFYHCQFPFPTGRPPSAMERDWFAGYDELIVNSRFTRLHCDAAINAFQLPEKPISVLAPPVKPVAAGSSLRERRRILSVGRFFTGGHSKRQDLLVQGFKRLVAESGFQGELHLAGAASPTSENLAYLERLIDEAAGAPVYFHVNVSAAGLADLYNSCGLYWHGTGLGTDLSVQPWAAEHFGISIVEAMSAGLVPFALGSGGPREIIEHGIDGFLYRDLDDLLGQTSRVLEASDGDFEKLVDAARGKAAQFTPDRFISAFNSRVAAL